MAVDIGPIEQVLGVVRGAAEKAHEFKTIADKFIKDWGLVKVKRTEGSSLPGRPTSTTIYDYPSQWSKESLDQKITDIRTTTGELGKQIKGLFNLAYKSPTDGQTAAPITTLPSQAAISPWLIIAGVVLLILIARKR